MSGSPLTLRLRSVSEILIRQLVNLKQLAKKCKRMRRWQKEDLNMPSKLNRNIKHRKRLGKASETKPGPQSAKGSTPPLVPDWVLN